MLIITDVETLYRIPDNELKKLTSKDRMVIFSSSGAQMPMSKFQALASIKAGMEIIEAPAGTGSMSEADRLVYTGYLYGAYASKAKAQEPVKIYSALFDKIAGAKDPGIIKSMGKIQICGAAEKKGSRKTVAAKKSSASANAPVKANKEAKPVKAAAKTSPLIEKMCSLGLTDMKAKLSKNEEHIIKALKDATDAEIGYKFQLKMYFGEADSIKIWDKTAKAFEQLKKLI